MTIPHAGRRLRLLTLAYGGMLLLWLSAEDSAVWPVTGFGLGLATLMLLLTLSDKLGGRRIPARVLPLAASLIGAVVGLGTAVTTVLLMFFKNAVHAHVFLDFPPGLMLAIVQRAPVWGLVGGLGGLGLALMWLALRLHDEQYAEEVAEDST